MKVKIGLDDGYFGMKVYCSTTNRDVYFRSTVREGQNKGMNKNIAVVMNGKQYIIGENKGKSNMDMNRVGCDIVKLLTLTAIAKCCDSDNIEAYIVKGLPAEYFDSQKQKAAEWMKSWNIQNIKVDGKDKTIKICAVECFPQSAGLPYLNEDKYKGRRGIIFDFGGNSLDVSLFHGLNLIESKTYPTMGMLRLYEKTFGKVNAKFNLNLQPSDMEDVLMNGVPCQGQRQSIDFLDSDIQDHIDEVITNLSTSFQPKAVDFIDMIGGGSIAIYKYFKWQFPHAELVTDAQMINAESFGLIAELMFQW